MSPKRNDKEFEISTAGLEFESGRASLVRAWTADILLVYLSSQSVLSGEWSFHESKKKKSVLKIIWK